MYAIKVAQPGKYDVKEIIMDNVDPGDVKSAVSKVLNANPPYTLVQVFDYDTNSHKDVSEWRK